MCLSLLHHFTAIEKCGWILPSHVWIFEYAKPCYSESLSIIMFLPLHSCILVITRNEIIAGIVNFKFKDFTAAVKDLSTCVKLDKSNKSAYTYLVRWWFGSFCESSSIILFFWAHPVSLITSTFFIRGNFGFLQGLSLSSLGEYRRAEDAHIKAIQLDQSFLEAWAHLAQVSAIPLLLSMIHWTIFHISSHSLFPLLALYRSILLFIPLVIHLIMFALPLTCLFTPTEDYVHMAENMLYLDYGSLYALFSFSSFLFEYVSVSSGINNGLNNSCLCLLVLRHLGHSRRKVLMFRLNEAANYVIK